jgi:phospholipid/cholesterol/gamma-HCH transport system substrate-binding protein
MARGAAPRPPPPTDGDARGRLSSSPLRFRGKMEDDGAMSSPRSIEVKVGILILTAVGLLAGFILIMGGINFQPTYSIFVDFDNPGGLQAGAPVKIAGVKVGKVVEIAFRGGEVNPASGKRDAMVRLKVRLEKRYQKSVHDNSIFYVTTQGVLGEQFLAIDPGSSDRPVLAEGAAVRALDPPRLDMILAESYELLHASVSALRDSRSEIGEAFDGLRKTLKGTGDFMERNGKKLDAVASNLEQITVHGDELVQGAKSKYVDNPQIERILNNAEGLTGAAARDAPPLLSDARETLANAKRLSATVGDPAQQAKIRQAINDVAEVTAKAKTLTGEAEAVVAHMRRGKGTIGALVMDEQLYDDLQELARDLKHNPWKFLWRE